MLATLGGLLALPLGLVLLLLPLLVPELSRPRDSAWGAVVLLLGLDLVTSADRLTGAPMLGVLCGALLIGRLAQEVGQGRWRQLSEEERQRLGSPERWSTSFQQLGITAAGLLERAGGGIGNLTTGIGRFKAGSGGLKGGLDRPATAADGQGGGAPSRSGGKRKGKRWVRPEAPPGSEAAGADPEPAAGGPAATDAATTPDQDGARPEASGSLLVAATPETSEAPWLPAAAPGLPAQAVATSPEQPAASTADPVAEPQAAWPEASPEAASQPVTAALSPPEPD